ncbi:MAG: hypothetical protein Kow00114_25150 [Kiloniellaceae bacterium]
MDKKQNLIEVTDVFMKVFGALGEQGGLTQSETFEIFIQAAARQHARQKGYADTYEVLVKVARSGIQEAAEELAALRQDGGQIKSRSPALNLKWQKPTSGFCHFFSANDTVSFADCHRSDIVSLRSLGRRVAPLTQEAGASKLLAQQLLLRPLMPGTNAEFLPYTVRLLIEAAGEDAALIIVRERGGSRVQIPNRAEGSMLEKLVGLDAARAITDALAGERLEIPHAKRYVNARLKLRGLSQEKRAAALRVSRRTIQSWDAQRRAEAG